MVKKLLHRRTDVLVRLHVHLFSGKCSMHSTSVLSTSAYAGMNAMMCKMFINNRKS